MKVSHFEKAPKMVSGLFVPPGEYLYPLKILTPSMLVSSNRVGRWRAMVLLFSEMGIKTLGT